MPSIPRRKLGKTNTDVTILGLGGEGVLRTYGREADGYRLINRALDLGINYCESARAYSDSETYYGLALRERRDQVFLTSKSHARDKAGARAHLEETLRNMNTDRLDLWQVHDVRTMDDVERIFGPNGAIEAFEEARRQGLTRFVGVTGHHDPSIMLECMNRYEFDTALMPVNPAEPAYKSFPDTVIPVANSKGMGVIGMKAYFRGFASQLPWYTSMRPFFRYALSNPICVAVIGCDTVEMLEQNVSYAQDFAPMSDDEMSQLVEQVAPLARPLMYYKP